MGWQVSLPVHAACAVLTKSNARTPTPLTDQDGRIFATLAGRPSDPSYDAACNHAYNAIRREGEAANFADEDRQHRRGHFPALAFGISQGSGHPSAHRLSEGAHGATIQALRSNRSIARIASYADGQPTRDFPPFRCIAR